MQVKFNYLYKRMILELYIGIIAKCANVFFFLHKHWHNRSSEQVFFLHNRKKSGLANVII